MCPIIADSLDSFEEITTAACEAGSAEKMNTAATASDFRNFAMDHLRDAERDGSDTFRQSAFERHNTLSFAARAVKARLWAAENAVRYDRVAGAAPASETWKSIADSTSSLACNYLIYNCLKVTGSFHFRFAKQHRQPRHLQRGLGPQVERF
jgi:hypothetical protein